jgi:hypothetical protein
MAYAKPSHPVFGLFGSEARTRIAFALIPDPETEISVPQLSELLHKPHGCLIDPVRSLVDQGLLELGEPGESGAQTYRRAEHPAWAVYETAKLVFSELGVEVWSVAVEKRDD